LLLAGAGTILAQQMSEPEALAHAEKFKDQVVRVVPLYTNGEPAQTGFGLVVGERLGKVYIATPYHVAFGNERPSSFGATPGVVFRGDRYTTIPARRLDVAYPPDDLAVLEVVPPKGLVLPRAPMVQTARLPRGAWVWNIGIGQDWDTPDRAGGFGGEDPVSRRLRVGALRTPPGASGGAGVTADGVIGIVLQDAGDYSLLLPVDRIVQLFNAWDLPVTLLTPDGAAPKGNSPLPPGAAFPLRGLDTEAGQQRAGREAQDQTCKQEEEHLKHLRASRDSDELLRFEAAFTCEKLRPQVVLLHESVVGR
jgi:hypothetical protein